MKYHLSFVLLTFNASNARYVQCELQSVNFLFSNLVGISENPLLKLPSISSKSYTILLNMNKVFFGNLVNFSLNIF